MPAVDSFVDTNVLLYAVSTEPSEAEDLNHGQDYDGVRVINPFVASSP